MGKDNVDYERRGDQYKSRKRRNKLSNHQDDESHRRYRRHREKDSKVEKKVEDDEKERKTRRRHQHDIRDERKRKKHYRHRDDDDDDEIDKYKKKKHNKHDKRKDTKSSHGESFSTKSRHSASKNREESRRERDSKKQKAKKKKKKSKLKMLDDENLYPMGQISNKIPEELLDGEENYFSHHSHFRFYLYRIKNVCFEDLTSDEARILFKNFTRDYNSGSLPQIFQEKVIPIEAMEQCQRTQHTWSFQIKPSEQEALKVVKAGVQKQTEYS